MLKPFAAVDLKRQTTTQNPLYQPQLLALLANEWRFYRVQPWFWLVLLLALAFALLATLGNPAQSAQPDKELLISHTKLLMMLQPLLIGALAPLAFLRDQQAGMAELTAATPVSQQQWCFSRAGGLLVVALGFQLLLLILAAAAVWNGIQPAQSHLSLGELAGISILLFLLQQVPALLLLVALQLWCSRHIPQIALLYLLTACCFIGYLLLAAATGSPVMAQAGDTAPLVITVDVVSGPLCTDALAGTTAKQRLHNTRRHPAVKPRFDCCFEPVVVLACPGRASIHKRAQINNRTRCNLVKPTASRPQPGLFQPHSA